MWNRHRDGEDETPHSRVIRPGGPPEWVSVVHRDGSISEVCVSGDDEVMTLAVRPAFNKEPHLRDMD